MSKRIFLAISDAINKRPAPERRGAQPTNKINNNNNKRTEKQRHIPISKSHDELGSLARKDVPQSASEGVTKRTRSGLNVNAVKSALTRSRPVSGRNLASTNRGHSQQSGAPSTSSGAHPKTAPPLRGASSVSSLDSKHKIAPINPLKSGSKTVGSRDKLDKLHLQKSIHGDRQLKHDKVTLTKNNNGSDLGNSTNEALRELESLQRQLEEMSREKSQLALQLAGNQSEIQALRTEVSRLKSYHEQQTVAMEQLSEENTSLRCRLRDVAHSPLSDNEKQQLLLDHRHHSSSAPASIAGLTGNIAGITPTTDLGTNQQILQNQTNDWDGRSVSSVSEVSVACLQDRIMQMQETHYSTSEELQATLQELQDLQAQLGELHTENERLADEKAVLLESLCRQTERLEDSRAEVDTLKQLLYRDGSNVDFVTDGSLNNTTTAHREQKLVELLKNAQDEREALLLKQEELNNELSDSRQTVHTQNNDIDRLSERVKLLESTLDATHAERKQLEQELAQAREHSSGRQIEISRLATLLENARAKISELELERQNDGQDKGELDNLLDGVRKEKDLLESKVATLQEQLSLCQCETQRLRDTIATLQEECKVTRNNAKCTQSELEYRCEQLKIELSRAQQDNAALQEAASEIQVQANCHLDDKRQLKALLADTQQHLAQVEINSRELERQLEEEKNARQEENQEWQQFQNDLLMTVRVANDFKTEAQQELQNLIIENKNLRDKVRSLEQQMEKLKVQQTVKSPTAPLRQNSVPADLQASQHSTVLSTVQHEMAVRRAQNGGLSRQDSRLSVRSLIESIESAAKQAKQNIQNQQNQQILIGQQSLPSTPTVECSQSSSTSSLNSINLANSNQSPNSPGSPAHREWNPESITIKPLREQQPTAIIKNNKGNIISDVYTKSEISKSGGPIGKTDDTLRESILQSAKGIDFGRRNSYSDLSERKDPLNALVKNGGSKRNALLKWCQQKTVGYRNIDITNFSSSWNDGLALCALLHTYLPDRIPYDTLSPHEKRRNFSLAFQAAEKVGIPTSLNINDMVQLERPDWQQVMGYVTNIYKHFET